jgi:hypothetical protein
MPEDSAEYGEGDAHDNPHLPIVVYRAWAEALHEKGLKRVIMLIMIGSITILAIPILPIMWFLQLIGVYHATEGYQWP